MKLLALDGGGVFGKAQAKILADAHCYNKFDVFVGTSIGSAIAASLALGLQNRVNSNFFDKWMPIVFKSRWRLPLMPKYSDKGLNDALQLIFGNALFGEVKKPLFITAADIKRKTLKVFDSTDFDDSRIPLWEIVRMATAAETYFFPWKGFADGGVFANNPSMVGVAAAVRVLKIPLSDLEVLSIGTGRNTRDEQCEPRSILQWGLWLIRSLLNGASDDMHDYFVRSMPLKTYVRIQFLREEDWNMDSINDMNAAMTKWAVDMKSAASVVREF